MYVKEPEEVILTSAFRKGKRFQNRAEALRFLKDS